MVSSATVYDYTVFPGLFRFAGAFKERKHDESASRDPPDVAAPIVSESRVRPIYTRVQDRAQYVTGLSAFRTDVTTAALANDFGGADTHLSVRR